MRGDGCQCDPQIAHCQARLAGPDDVVSQEDTVESGCLGVGGEIGEDGRVGQLTEGRQILRVTHCGRPFDRWFVGRDDARERFGSPVEAPTSRDCSS